MAVRVARWLFTLIGGLFLGAGLELHGLIAIAWRMIGEVDNTFFMFRAIGRATIFMLGSERRIALAIKEIPPSVLEECSRTAWMLVIVGGLFSVTAPFLRHHAPARSANKPPKPPKPRKPKAAKAPKPPKAPKSAPKPPAPAGVSP
jgi:hypothetical protein